MSGVAPRARVRRVGIVYLVLFGTGTAGALASALYVQDPAAVVATLLPTAAGAYLAWSAYRADRVEAAAAESPEAVADRLALAVRRQWETEARVRRLADPYPLPVSWRAADAGLAEVALVGGAGEIGELFEGLPGRRLLVLGDPGSGKTVLLVRLLLALIGRRRAGEAVPVLFPLASWDPAAEDLSGWMERRLVQDHAELGAVDGGVTVAALLLDRRLVLPVLDGFDELPVAVSALALHRIAEALPYGCGMVLSSRPAEYRAALRPRDGVPARLTGMAGIRLEPLRADDVAAYLLRDAGGEATEAATRWRPVVEALGTDAPVARALSSPLMVSLARATYNPRPGDGSGQPGDVSTGAGPLPDLASGSCRGTGAGQLPDPADLLRCPTSSAVAAHLFDAFVDAAYRPHPRRPSRWTAVQARTVLAFLARHMERGYDGAAEVAWWKLHGATSGLLPRVLAGVVLGGLAWLIEGMTLAVLFRFTHDPTYAPDWGDRGGLGVLAGCLCGGLVGGIAAGAVAAGMSVVAAIGHLTPALVLERLADSGSLALAGMMSCGLAVGHRPALRPPAAWDRRVLLTGVVTGFLYVAAYGNVCGVISAVVLTVAACAVGVDGAPPPRTPVARIRWVWSPRGLAMGLLAGALMGSVYLAEGLLTGVLGGDVNRYYVAPADPLEAVWESWQQGSLLALNCMLVQGLRAVPVDLAGPADAAALLRNDRRTLATCTVTAALLLAAVFGAQDLSVVTVARLWFPDTLFTDGYGWLSLSGLIPALLMGLAVGLRQTAWSRYAVARWQLVLRAGLPRDLMAFLADAHEQRGVLRRVGAVYQFRHIELQHHLADRER
ncbi:NACHT domain-containing protein [Streptomyces sp. NBC_00124]|uniref:NACHT domain-containing protein n=1 Tax=Streptomyces sp. NBC_00124 TaxID=2975662 RepID=UPI00225A0C41|nr:NACHT domain-containing protein [Streptomyces sp. NBC_00124]MCX5364890.1 NACHT domain-containing protein [Streptomyces sp. NBC_00124]